MTNAILRLTLYTRKHYKATKVITDKPHNATNVISVCRLQYDVCRSVIFYINTILLQKEGSWPIWIRLPEQGVCQGSEAAIGKFIICLFQTKYNTDSMYSTVSIKYKNGSILSYLFKHFDWSKEALWSNFHQITVV